MLNMIRCLLIMVGIFPPYQNGLHPRNSAGRAKKGRVATALTVLCERLDVLILDSWYATSGSCPPSEPGLLPAISSNRTGSPSKTWTFLVPRSNEIDVCVPPMTPKRIMRPMSDLPVGIIDNFGRDEVYWKSSRNRLHEIHFGTFWQ